MNDRLDALFEPWNRSDAPGLAVGVALDGAPLYRRGFGMASLESGVALGPATRLRIASVSKHFTALLALLLAEDGRLDLDRSIGSYLPELPGVVGEATLRLLLQHRGGQRCYLDLGAHCRGASAPPVGAMLALQARQTAQNFPPGEAMIYSNGGYQLVSLAIERQGGAPLAEQFRTRLFEPLGMADTMMVASDYLVTPGMATMHVPEPGGGWRRGLLPLHENRGDGAIVSTVDDMLRWMAHLRRRDRFGSPGAWAQLVERPVYPDGTVGSYALGLTVDDYRGRPVLRHAGGAVGGSAEMLTFPEDGLDVIILANGAPDLKPVALARQVADIVLGERLGERRATVPAASHEALLGHWWSPETRMVYSLMAQDGLLTGALCGAPRGFPLEPTADGAVLLRLEGMGEISFRRRGAELEVAFCGAPSSYRRLEPGPGPQTATAYYNRDADCTVTLAASGEDAVARFSDGWGGVETKLSWFQPGVALTSARQPADYHHAALTFTDTGFWLATSRTRNLWFEARR